MGRLFGKLLKWIMLVGAAVVITLALLVGVARLMLPQVSSYRAEIRNWVLSFGAGAEVFGTWIHP